ncbi:MAG: hypothetical protein M1379_18585 [Firmicutes bacterium]|nr:hypothetical protein [Bacillota bacterium]
MGEKKTAKVVLFFCLVLTAILLGTGGLSGPGVQAKGSLGLENDKMLHLGVFAATTVAIREATGWDKRQTFWVMMGLAAASEFAQYPTQDRSFEWSDFFADVTGVSWTLFTW